MQTDVRHVGIHIGDVVRIIEEPFKGIRRELLAKSGAVIDLAVLVVDEGRSIDASFIVFSRSMAAASAMAFASLSGWNMMVSTEISSFL